MPQPLDLWGDNFDFAIRTPGTIMKEQASLLSMKTQQLVTAEVVNKQYGDGVQHIFRLVVPSMDFYKYELFRLVHGISLYPGEISWNGEPYRFKEEAELTHILGRILKSDATIKVISSLAAQAKE